MLNSESYQDLLRTAQRCLELTHELTHNHSTGITGVLPISVLVSMCRCYVAGGVTPVGGPN